MSRLDQVIDQMQAHGLPTLPPGHPVLDGKIHRFGKKKKAWYALREFRLQSGEYVVAGGFGIWQGESNGAIPVRIDWEGISEDERREIEARQKAFEEKEREKRRARNDFAARRAQAQWNSASWITAPGVSCPYLERKQIPARWGKVTDDGAFLIPLMKPTLDAGQLVGVQKIAPDGSKLFNKGMDKTGAACLLTDISADSPLVMIGEGFATVASVVAATAEKYPAFVALDVGNLLPVAQRVREICPSAHIIFLADDDWMIDERFRAWWGETFPWREFPFSSGVPVTFLSESKWPDDKGIMFHVSVGGADDEHGDRFIQVDIDQDGVHRRTVTFRNAGIRGAKAAAQTIGNASVVWPVFSGRGQNKWTDFNDLHVYESLDAVRGQVEAAVARLGRPEDPPGNVVDFPSSPKKPKGKPPEKTGAGEKKQDGRGRPKKEYPDEFWNTVNYLLENFTLIYGDGVAWDGVNRMLIEIKNMRHAFGNDAVRLWLGNAERRMILKKNLVFDPALEDVPADMVNLFGGIQIQPNPGRCEKILELLSHLCGGNSEFLEWVLKWIAYPLQNPGAKMRTAIIMHGDEGSGKNLFWERVVAGIYGEYAGIIGNAQIDGQFNEWASRKLFVVADEVVNRTELRTVKGRLKQMITGETIYINAKNLPERVEANHMNIVFLSNEDQPVALDRTDRRYLVIWTPPGLDESFYWDVRHEIDSGGIAAFYHYLLHKVSLDGFNEHTRPLGSDAKEALKLMSLPASDRFYAEWSEGLLPLPFMTCDSDDIYSGFLRWCHLSGERYPHSRHLFGKFLPKMGLTRKRITCPPGSAKKYRTVYLVGDPPEGERQNDWIEGACVLFEKDLRRYRNVYEPE